METGVHIDSATAYKERKLNPDEDDLGMAAACLSVTFLAEFFAFRMDDISLVSIGGIERDYKDAYVVESGSVI